MGEYSKSEQADEDIIDIYVFGEQRFGKKQAVRYILELEDVFSLLASTPRMGRAASGLPEGVRRHEHKSHVIFYEETVQGVLVLGVVHSASLRRLRL